ncbi:hypothetical protein CDD83_9272 [Cordyceps sp. RAO-2017]|nr:hypothetical protein CDD83_9272 [Cordyceps sp. RAO-2017]
MTVSCCASKTCRLGLWPRRNASPDALLAETLYAPWGPKLASAPRACPGLSAGASLSFSCFRARLLFAAVMTDADIIRELRLEVRYVRPSQQHGWDVWALSLSQIVRHIASKGSPFPPRHEALRGYASAAKRTPEALESDAP